MSAGDAPLLAARLRAAGCVFAEDEAAVLLDSDLIGPALESAVVRREAGEPLEHVVGWVDFGGLRLSIGSGVFIPRQRSLQVARRAVEVARNQGDPVVLEPYAGVAPLAATVAAARVASRLYVADLDPVALEFARSNVPDATVFCGDGLDPLPASLSGTVSLIVAVPPYVPDAAGEFLPGEARDYEPARTHSGGADGLRHVRRLIDDSRAWLRPGGVLLSELHRTQADAAITYATAAGFSASATIGEDGHTTTLEAHLPQTHPLASRAGRAQLLAG